MRNFLVLFVIVSVLISLSFLGGIDLLTQQFCSVPSAGGFCGMLHGIALAMGHLSSIQLLLVFVVPLMVGLIILIRPLSARQERLPVIGNVSNPIHISPQPLSAAEYDWLVSHIASPQYLLYLLV